MPDPINNSALTSAHYDFATPSENPEQCRVNAPPQASAPSAGTASLTSQVPSDSATFVANLNAHTNNDAAEACIDASINAVITCGLMSVTPGGALVQFLAGAACGGALIDVHRQCFDE